MSLLAILIALGFGAYFRYRAHQVVNTSIELTEGLLIRGKDEARSQGLPLPPALVAPGGLTEASTPGPAGAQSEIHLQIRKRVHAGDPPILLTSRAMPGGATLEIETSHLGKLDLDANADLEGVYFEVVLKSPGAPTATSETILTIPIDVNGDVVILPNDTITRGKISFVSNDYRRGLEISNRGAIKLLME